MSTPKGGTNASKDVIYIDVDDEITGIIDKVKDSDKKIVALVLPKRATVLQSVVNMKLLKRAATDAKKNLVLITSEAGLTPLAGSVGMHVAKSLNSKPEIPEAPERPAAKAEEVAEPDDEEPEIRLDGHKTVGELSGDEPAVGASADGNDEDDTIELDDDTGEDAQVTVETDKPKKPKDKKFKIPNFNKFRLALVLSAVGVIVLSMVGYAAVAVWPKAKIVIKTDSEAVNSSVILTLKTAPETELDAEQGVIRAEIQEVKKTAEQQVPTTGQKNVGEKAEGTVRLALSDCSKNQVTVPAGTGVSAAGKVFITQSSATMESVKIGPNCRNADFPDFSTKSVAVVAQAAGASYNIGASNFSVAGYTNVTGSSSAAMTGGTDSVIKVVSQADVDAAKQKIAEQDTAAIRQELQSALIGRDLYAMESTLSVGTPEVKLSAEVNAEAETVTVTQTTNYTMYGVELEELQKIIEKSVSDKIDTKKQSIIDYGLDDALFSIQGVDPNGASVSMQTTVVAGTELDVEAIKKQVAGKKAGDAQEIISANPGVTDVTVTYSPFWVSSIPKKTDKITVVVQEPQVVQDDEAESP